MKIIILLLSLFLTFSMASDNKELDRLKGAEEPKKTLDSNKVDMDYLDMYEKELNRRTGLDADRKIADYNTANSRSPEEIANDVSYVTYENKYRALANTLNIVYIAKNKYENFNITVAQSFKNKYYGTEFNTKNETEYLVNRPTKFDGFNDYLLDNPATSWEDLYKKEIHFKELIKDKKIIDKNDLLTNIPLTVFMILFDIDILIFLGLFYWFYKDLINSIRKHPLSYLLLATIYPIIKIISLNPNVTPSTDILIIAGTTGFLIFLNIIYNLNINKFTILGFYLSIKSIFSKSIDKKIEYLNSKMMEIINSTPKGSLLLHNDLDIEQKQLIKLTVKGCFTLLDSIYSSHSGEIINLNTLNRDSEKYSNYFLYSCLKWNLNEITQINKVLKNLEILQSNAHSDFNILGSNIAGNFYSNDSINKYLGYDNLSKENGIRLLEEFIKILENKKSN